MIAIVDYGVGNLASAQKAFAAVGAPAALVRDPAGLRQATAVVLGFVAIAGAYLGLADFVAKEIVEFVL